MNVSPDPSKSPKREPLLPELWELHKVARELGSSTQVLVEASSRGEFPPVVRIGAKWHVKADLMREWIERQHAPEQVSQAHVDRMKAAARAAVSKAARTPVHRRGGWQ